jgi:hypothetical protein
VNRAAAAAPVAYLQLGGTPKDAPRDCRSRRIMNVGQRSLEEHLSLPVPSSTAPQQSTLAVYHARRDVMSNYSAAVVFFSQLCQNQLNQPLSKLDAANDGLGATLVLRAEP